MDQQEFLTDAVQRHGFAGAAVGISHHGERRSAVAGVADRCSGVPVTVHTTMRIASVTKPIVAVAAVLACRASSGALDRPIIEDLPDLRERWKVSPELTLADLLSHTSGLYDESLTREALAGLGDGDDALTKAAGHVLNTPQIEPPGTTWRYYNGNYYLAGHVIARLRGQTFESALTEVLLWPAQMTGTGFAASERAANGHVDGSRIPNDDHPRAGRPAAGLWSTTEELLSFAEFMLRDAELTAAVRAPMTPSTSVTQYGLGWSVADRLMFHHGATTGSGFRSLLVVVPEERYVAAVIVNDETSETLINDTVGTVLTEATGIRTPW